MFQDFFYVPWFAAWLENNRYILHLWFDKQVCYSEIWEEQPTHQEPMHAPDKLQRQQEKWWLCQVSLQQGMQKNCVIKYWQRKGTAWCIQFVVKPLKWDFLFFVTIADASFIVKKTYLLNSCLARLLKYYADFQNAFFLIKELCHYPCVKLTPAVFKLSLNYKPPWNFTS